MANINIHARDIEGLLPALDPRQVTKPYVVEGRNFLMSVEGPFAAFGNKISSVESFVDPANFTSFEIEDRYFYMMRDGVYEYSETLQSFIPRLTYTNLTGLNAWTFAHVGGEYYFARKNVGVLRYDPVANTWLIMNDPFLPTGIVACCAASGRLMVLGSNIYSWSALGDGLDMTPSLVTGAGFQSVNLIGGRPLSIHELADGGAIVYTSNGTIRVSFAGGAGVFRHRHMSHEAKLLNDFCVVNIDKTKHVIITEKGMFETVGTVFNIFDPLFSEFLQKTLIPRYSTGRTDSFRLTYHAGSNRLYLSLGFSDVREYYQKAYVRDLSLERWSQFNRAHTGFGEILFEARSSLQKRFGYMDPDGFFRAFQGETYVEDSFDGSNEGVVQYQPLVQLDSYKDGDVWIMSSVSEILSYDPNDLDGFPAGWYKNVPVVNYDFFNVEEDWNILVAEEDWLTDEGEEDYMADSAQSIVAFRPNALALDSQILVGPFRFEEQQYPDEIGNVTDLMVGAGDAPPEDDIEDYMDPDNNAEEDWNVLSGDEDWGSGGASGQDFACRVYGKNDGRTIFTESEEPAQSVGTAQRYYPVFTNGIFTFVELEAVELNHSFQLKLLEISGNVAGRL